MKHAPRGPIKVDPLSQEDLRAMPNGGEAVRCSATNRKGERCENPAMRGGWVCRNHGGKAPQVMNKALERIRELQPKAVQVLEQLLDRKEFPTVQMAAVRDVLDRTEGKAAEQVRLTGADDGPIEIVVKKPW